MGKSLLYGGNSATQTVPINGTINLGTVNRRYGNNINLIGGNIVTAGDGYYSGVANFVIDGTASGNVVITMYDNGVAIPNANATKSVTDGVIDGMVVPFATRNKCCLEHIITAEISGVGVDIINVGVLVRKD